METTKNRANKQQREEEDMPLWDSVQRSLEKASHEAARIARTQRLRSISDGLTRQINTQNNAIVNKAMELFVSGQLTQNELLPICQEMLNLHQQLNQAQNELKQLQIQANQAQGSQTPQPLPPGTAGPGQSSYQTPNPTSTEGNQNPLNPPSEYQSYMDSTNSYTVPPPPPGMEPLTVSSIETITGHMATPLPPAPPSPLPAAMVSPTGNRLCATCHFEVQPNTAFCHNCGSPVQEAGSQHSPTMRGGTPEQLQADDRATQVGDASQASDKEKEV